MSEEATNLRYECLEAGCDWTTESSSEQELVESVNAHMAGAHNTFELEDVIIDNAAATTVETSTKSSDLGTTRP
jgi:predicted small metal-binding protein